MVVPYLNITGQNVTIKHGGLLAYAGELYDDIIFYLIR
jgi:hypothetical protein